MSRLAMWEWHIVVLRHILYAEVVKNAMKIIFGFKRAWLSGPRAKGWTRISRCSISQAQRFSAHALSRRDVPRGDSGLQYVARKSNKEEITALTRLAKFGRKHWKADQPPNSVLIVTGTELRTWE